MKIKKYGLVLALILLVMVFSGCVNVTYRVNLTDDGKADVDLTVLYNSGEYSYDYEKIDEIVSKYKEAGFKVKDITDKGMKGFQIKKENIRLDEQIDVQAQDVQIDILSDILKSTEFDKGFLSNEYDIDTTIDLSKYSNLSSLVVNNEQITDEDYKKLLSEMNLKLIIELEQGHITETNSSLSKENKKTAEWVLIPGAKNKIELEATTRDKLAVTGTVVILSVVFIIALGLFILLMRMYVKKRKNNE